jgi:hypothetical protein
MKNKIKILYTLAIMGAINFGSTINASAKVDAYLVKDSETGIVYEYDYQMLIDGLMNYYQTSKDPFYEDFQSKSSKFGIYAYHDSTGKYIDSSVVKEALISSYETGQPFSLSDFTESKEAASSTSIPKTINKASVNEGNIAYSDKDTGKSTSDTNTQGETTKHEESTKADTSSNATLKILTDPIYQDAAIFFEGLALMYNNDGFSYIDTNGKVKIGPIKSKLFKYNGSTVNKEVKAATDFHDGLAILYDISDANVHQIVIDKNGNEVFQFSDEVSGCTLGDYVDGMSIASRPYSTNGAKFIVDKNGKTIELNIKEITGTNSNRIDYLGDGLLAYNSQANGLWGYIDINTKKEVIKPQFEDVRKFYEGIAPAKLNGKWGFIDKKGNFIIKPQYEYFAVNDFMHKYQVFDDGLACVEKNGKWGVIDKSGKVIADFKYDDAFLFTNGFATIKKDGKYGVIDRNGKVVVDFKYSYAVPFSDGVACVGSFGGFGFVDTEGKEIIKGQYDNISYFKNNVALVKKDGVYYLINKNGEKIGSETWKFEDTYICYETPDIVFYEQNGKWGIAKITY